MKIEMTITTITHTEDPKGFTLRTSIPKANMTTQNFTDLENAAVAQEGLMEKGQLVWTEDSLFASILPRGKRPVS